MINFSTMPPVCGRNAFMGGMPNLTGNGNNQGTPSWVMVSATKCEI